jgi:hypothetical protein
MTIRRAGTAAFVWVMGFLAWHVVWALTGLPAPDPGQHHGAARVALLVFTVVVWVMAAVGVLTPLAMMRGWRWFPPRLQLAACWAGCVLLTLRGGSGVLDDAVRLLGVLPRGLTGLSTAQVYGTPHPSWWAVTATAFTDVLFAAGGAVFALAVLALRRRPRTGPRAAE